MSVILPGGKAQDLDKEVSALVEHMAKGLVAKQKTKLAVIDFTDIEGRPTEFGRYLAEQVSVEFVNASGISVMDRANLKSILQEHKLTEEGLVNPETAKKLGQFAGVDVIVTGTVTSLDHSFAVTTKAIATDTAEIVSAGKMMIEKTREIQQLGAHMVASSSSQGSAVRDASEAAPLATKDFGSVRVILRSVRRTKNRFGVDGAECAFEITNLDVSQPILCAGNGEESHLNLIRAQLQNSSGEVLQATECRGLTCVCVYGTGRSPAEIAQYIMTGQHINGGRGYYDNEHLWQGDMTRINPGDSVRVTIVFFPRNRGEPVNLDELQLNVEIVIGTGGFRQGRGNFVSPASAQLYTLSLDGLSPR